MDKIKKIKLPNEVTYDIADASIATMGNNTDTNKENKTVVSDYIASRAENLLTNGTSLLGNNYNFSALTYDGSDTYYAAGSFRKDKPAAYWSFVNDEFIPVDVNATYRFDFYTKSTKTGTAPQFNGMIKAYDIDKKEIASYQVSPRANTLTTLAQDLRPGDTKVYFTSIANFSTTSLTTNNSSLLFYGYKNSFGYEYAPETYTQWRYASLWSTVEQMDFENNTITLSQPWPSSRPTFLAGTPVSQGQDGSGALYCSVNDVSITYTETPGVWEHCWYHINGLQAKNTFPTSQFPFGTAYIKVGLMNRLVYGTGESFWISTMSFTTVGASVDQVKTTATTTQNYDYPLLFKSQQNANTEMANTRFADVTYNPYSRTLKINGTSIAPGTLNTTATTSQTTKSSESLRGAITLHKISKTGSYNDLLDKPTLTRDVFWCTYGTTTYQEISDEVTAGRLPVVHYSDKDYVYYGPNGNYLYFTTTLTNNGYYVRVDNNNTWASGSLVFEKTSNKTATLSDLSTDTQYPTAKAVYDAIEDVREIAEGRKTAYVISAVTNPIFNTDEPTIDVNGDITDVDGRTIALAGLSKGDVFYVTESGIPDRWVGDNQATIMPEGYTRLAYIEGAGTQYLDTGVIPTTTDLSMTLDMMWTGDPSTLQTFESFGGFMASGTTPRFGISKYSGKYMFGINTTTSPNSPIPDNRRHVLRCYSDNAQQILYVDGALVISTTVSASALSSNTLPIWLFARNSASANIAKMRLYGATIAVAGEIYNYVPCLNSNNEVGIYDLNHDTFIKSAVATQFIAGPTMTNAIQMYALDSSQIDLDSFYTKAQTNALLSEKQNVIDAQNPLPYAYLSGAPNLATVATTGSYNDLSDTPTLAAVATSGDYEDLSNTPTIPDVSNFVERNELATVATTGSYTDLENTPAIIGDVRVNGSSVVDINNVAQVSVPTQTSDLTNNSGFITNATDSLTNYTKTSDLATVATSGAYNDLSGKPSLATVATSGSYNDLLNKPTPPLYWCTYGTTTYAEITQALSDGKLPVVTYNNSICVYCRTASNFHMFTYTYLNYNYYVRVNSSDTWNAGGTYTQNINDKTTTLSGASTNAQYPSAKATYDAIEAVRELAEGKKRAIVCSDVTNPVLNSQAGTVTLATLIDINGVTYPANILGVGDTVYVSETDVPDRWVSSVEPIATITDLTDTTWVFNDRLNGSMITDFITFNLNYTIDSVNYTQIRWGPSYQQWFSPSNPSQVFYKGSDSTYWVDETYKIITVTGGTDATNTELVAFFNANATLQTDQKVAILSKLETAKVSVTDVQVNNTSVVNANGVASISLAAVATSGDYTDLTNTPILADVATTGDYEDLLNTPTIPDISTKVDKVVSTDNAIVRFDGTAGAVQNNTHVIIDDNGNLKTDKAFILSGITGSISTGESRLYFGNSTSDYKSYLASNTSGAFSLASPTGAFTFYAGGTYNCMMTSTGADLGRNDNGGTYCWNNLYMKGSINRHKTGSSGWYTFNFPTKSGTFALLDDIPSVNYPVTSVNGQTGAVVLTIPADLGDLTNNAGYLKLTDLATVASTGSYTDLIDLPTLPQNLSDLGEDSTSIHVSQTQAAAWSAKQDALTFDNEPTEDSTNPVTSDGIYDALQDVREIAEGKRQTYVVSIEDNPNAGLDSQDDPVTIQNSLVDVEGNPITLASLAIGDSILITETDYPDRWVSSFADKVALADADGASTQSSTPSPEASVPITSSTYVDVSYHDVELRGIGTNVDMYTASTTTITRAIGIYTFTGTETFDNGASATLANHRVFRNTSLFSSSYVPIMSGAVPFLCTHFTTEYTSTYTVANQLTRWMSGSTPSSQGMFCIAEETIGITSSATQSQAVAAFQSWLAAQYNNGNPVRIYYPQATQTTEVLPLYRVGERTGAVLNSLETAKVPITSISVNSETITPVAGNVDISVPTTYLKSVTTVDRKGSNNEVTSPNNILRITKQDNTTFDYEANSLKFKDFSNNQEADENQKTINLNLAPYNQAGIWYTVASSVIAKMANAPGNVASGECMLEVRPLGSTRYTLQIFTWKAGGGFAVWQRVQNNTNVWGNWSPTAVSQMSTAVGTTISTSDTDYLATVTTNGQKLYRSTKKVSDFVTVSTSQNVNGTKTFTVDQVMSNNRSLKWTKTDSTTVAMLIMPSDNKFYIGNSGVDLYFNNSLLPANTYDLGSATAKWNNAYVNSALYVPTLNNGADITVPTTGGTLALLSDLSGFLTADTTALENYSTTNSFDDVAFSGSYNDLSDTPTIPTNADYVDLTTTQSIGGQKTFTANRMYINGETHFNAGGSPTDYAYGQAVGIYGKAMMCNTLYVSGFKYRTSAMNTAGKPATVWNLPNLDSGSTYTLATTSDLTDFITKSVNNLDNYTLTSDLATVATSGSYNDLTNKPTIPTTTSQLTNNSGFITASDIPLVFEDYTIPTT